MAIKFSSSRDLPVNRDLIIGLPRIWNDLHNHPHFIPTLLNLEVYEIEEKYMEKN